MTPTLAICLLAVLAAIAAAVFDLGGTSSPSGTYGSSATLSIQGFAFGPALVTPAKVVTVKNLDSAAHTVTSDEAGLFGTDAIAGGSEATITAPDEPGQYTFHCSIHASMHGTLVVATG